MTELSELGDLVKRMQSTQTPALRLVWARHLVAARRRQGGYPEIQDPLTNDMADALARHEAQALVHNLEGERFDE